MVLQRGHQWVRGGVQFRDKFYPKFKVQSHIIESHSYTKGRIPCSLCYPGKYVSLLCQSAGCFSCAVGKSVLRPFLFKHTVSMKSHETDSLAASVSLHEHTPVYCDLFLYWGLKNQHSIVVASWINSEGFCSFLTAGGGSLLAMSWSIYQHKLRECNIHALRKVKSGKFYLLVYYQRKSVSKTYSKVLSLTTLSKYVFNRNSKKQQNLCNATCAKQHSVQAQFASRNIPGSLPIWIYHVASKS